MGMPSKKAHAEAYWAKEFATLLAKRIEELRVKLARLEKGKYTRVRVKGHRRPARKAHYVKPHWRVIPRKD